MEILLDKARLVRLLDSFYVITGFKFGIFDSHFKELFSTAEQSPFCQLIKDTQAGHAKCLACDGQAFKTATANRDIYMYRCHAGLMEVCAPIVENETVIAYLMYGQILDDTPYEEQWNAAREKSGWHRRPDQLKEHFFGLERIPEARLVACAEIMSACTSYIWLKRVVQSYQQTDAQRLVSFIQQNYERNLTLDEIAVELNMSKTKLCIMAKSQLGKTVGQLIAGKRLEAAKTFLQTTDLSISEISTRIGIADYNYFSRLFKLQEGLTPTQYKTLFH